MKEKPLSAVSLPTAWNQVEATMAYSRGLPLLVIVDERVRCDGLLEKGNDWYVQEVTIDPVSLNSPAFNGVLGSWRDRVERHRLARSEPEAAAAKPDIATMSVGQLFAALKPPQLWGALVAVGGALAGAFALGAKLAG